MPSPRATPARLVLVAFLLLGFIGVLLQSEMLKETPHLTTTKHTLTVAALRSSSIKNASSTLLRPVHHAESPPSPSPSPPPRPPFRRFQTQYECIGWRATTNCSPDGTRDPVHDLGCDVSLPGGTSGFCLYRDRRNLAPRRLFEMHCNSLSPHVLFDCDYAASLHDYSTLSLLYTHDAEFAFDTIQQEAKTANSGFSDLSEVSFERGISYVVYGDVLASAYSSLRLLREAGTVLPIEVWYKQTELSPTHPLLLDLVRNYGVLLREILDPLATDYYTKLYAVFYSCFDSVLLLDADNFAVRDPTYLFETVAFTTTGAIFWPDFWHPSHTIFQVQSHSLLWQVLDVPFVDMFEQESGQVLIDRRRHLRALNVLMYYGFMLPRVHEELVWGDKDLFRLAWLKTHSDFHMIQTPPASAGTLQVATQKFCGLTMVQHDPSGEILFLHRNLVKLRADTLTQRLWTHVLQFKRGRPREKYVIEWSKLFKDVESCWGRIEAVEAYEDFTLTPITEFPFHGIESRLLQLMEEAGEVIYHGMKAVTPPNVYSGGHEMASLEAHHEAAFFNANLANFKAVTMCEDPFRRPRPWTSKSFVLRVLVGLSVLATVLQFASFHKVIRESDSRSGGVHGLVSAWRLAFRAASAPPPPDFDPAFDGNLSTDYECVGWRETTDCSPDHARSPHYDLPCNANVTKDMAGYCEFRLRASPETLRRVLPIHCDSLRRDVVIQCQDAPTLLTYGQHATTYEHDPASSAAVNQRELLELNGLSMHAPLAFDRGIVFAIYEPGLLSVYASIRSLRAQGCTLPIELWYDPTETDLYHPLFQELLAIPSLYRREVKDPKATRFYAKLHAIFYSAFDRVLLLDTDNFAVRDPTYLFETVEFTTTGAIFWPDYWRPNQTIFHIHARNLVWPIFDLAFVDMFEQESGQVLIDRRRHEAALNVLMYYGFTLPRLHEELRLLWGDKDLYRFAWMKTNTSFHYINRPPGSAGRLNLRTRLFCGLTMVQHDPSGDIIFLHRNTLKLDALPGRRQVQWTHIQQFRQDVAMELYDIKRSWDIFPDIPKCWGKPRHFARSHTLTPIADFPFKQLERDVLAFASDGVGLLEAWRLSNADHNTRAPPLPPPDYEELP